MSKANAILMACGILALSACNNAGEKAHSAASNQVQRIGNAEKGRQLFIEKGCVICHSVNGVGGKAAPPLDAQTQNDIPDPVGFAARMWRGAPAMIELQALEIGYSIWLDPQEMVDLATFNADIDQQKEITLEDVGPGLIESFLDERFWEAEDWTDFLEDGQEGVGAPPLPDEDIPDEDIYE